MQATNRRTTSEAKIIVNRAPGLDARMVAQRILEGVLVRQHSLDEVIEHVHGRPEFADVAPRDRALGRLIATVILRRHGSLEAVLASFIERPLPLEANRVRHILLIGAAQLLFLDTPPHAAINLAVEQCRTDKIAQRFHKLVNAVLRRVATDGRARLEVVDWPRVDIPGWIWDRWAGFYGLELTKKIAAGCLVEPALDISVNGDAVEWAKRLGGHVLTTGSIRLLEHGRVEELAGFAEGIWWVQDAAAALPTRLLGNVAGKRVADLCAAPGGKTASLAAAGALVTAVDRSGGRLRRLHENLKRLKLTDQVEVVTADLRTWIPGDCFDAVLLDAPCTATGTIRRHPDILHLKRPGDITELAKLQHELLLRAADWVRPGGTLIYCTCSLEPEEGPERIAAFLSARSDFARSPVGAEDAQIAAEWITSDGDLRTLPHHAPGRHDVPPGMDGFFAARLIRKQV